MTYDTDVLKEFGKHLSHIQELSREYPIQSELERKMTFASIRIASESIATLADDELSVSLATDVRHQVNHINSSLDDLSSRYGSEEEGKCGVCSKGLNQSSLPNGDFLYYCSHCPEIMLDAIRKISDLTGADTL